MNEVEAAEARAKAKVHFPILQALVNSGDITFLGDQYVGHATDGTALAMGMVGDEARLETYLNDFPNSGHVVRIGIMEINRRWHIAYVIEGQRWDAHNIRGDMLQFEIERLQDCENARILSFNREE